MYNYKATNETNKGVDTGRKSAKKFSGLFSKSKKTAESAKEELTEKTQEVKEGVAGKA